MVIFDGKVRGIKLISSEKVEDLAPYGQGPGDIERWMALTFDGSYLVDVEASAKLKYFKKSRSSYTHEKTEWLFQGNDFPFVKGAVRWKDKWFISGFSSSDPRSEQVRGYFISVFQDKGRPARRLLYKDFQGSFRGPYLLTVHLRQHADRIWAMLESEPTLFVFSCEDETLEKAVQIPMPSFYRSIRDYWPFKRDSLSNIKRDFEDWLLSYSRIENLRINDQSLIIQLRTADERLPRFALLFYSLEDFALKNVYFTSHLFLTERNGRYYFFENGDPGLDEAAQNINILIYEQR